MVNVQKTLFSLVCFILILLFVFNQVFAISEIEIIEMKKDSQRFVMENVASDSTDIPTWSIGDTWIYEADIYSDTEEGVLDISSDALNLTVEERTSMLHANKIELVYILKVSGEVYGTINSSLFSGDVDGDIEGTVIIRQADLSIISTNISIFGIIEWLIFEFDFDISSDASYFPGFEYFDFPMMVNQSWNISSTVHQNSSFYVETFIDNTSESTEQINGYASCIGIDTITVPLGDFSCYHVLSEENESSIESWYNSSVKNMVKLYLIQRNDTSMNIINMNLTSYFLNDQEIRVIVNPYPQPTNVSENLSISGYVYDDTDEGISGANVSVLIPFTDNEYLVVTNATGAYFINISTPLIIDATKTSYDIGSDGVLVTAAYNGDVGYILASLSVIGIGITNIQIQPAIQTQSGNVNITCEIYSVASLTSSIINISGPIGFEQQNTSLLYFNESTYYFSQNYSITGNYSFYIWANNTIGNTNKTHFYTFQIISDNIILDVNQSLYDRGFRVMPGWDGAQEFVSSLNFLSHVDIYMTKWGDPWGPIVFQICEDTPNGNILFLDTISKDEVSSFPTFDWVTIDFPILPVTSGERYVIVLRDGDEGDTHNCLMWGWYDSYGGNGPYQNGEFLFRKLGYSTWLPIHDWDFTFRLYGYES